jgi:tetratricopeptide (TPR) repeat protein
MYSTDQFRVFSGAAADRLLSRPRRLVQEDRSTEAERAYQELLLTNPDLRAAWMELFSLLRLAGRHTEALALAERSVTEFGDLGLSATLRGAALVELGRFRDGLNELDHAAQLDPDSGLVWHEAGYAAFRLGELSRALMALDRAFALEPHGATLQLRGRVLRQAGRYLAAEVAFEGAAQAAEFPAQRSAAEAEIRVTRRFAAFPGSKPEALPPARRWFAEQGAVLLTGMPGPPATEADLLHGMVQLTRDLGWQFTALVPLEAWPGWYDLAQSLDIPVSAVLPADASAVPLVAIRDPASAQRWSEVGEAVAAKGRGATLALVQPEGVPPADITGQLAGVPPRALDLAFAVETARHPEGRLAGRVLA